MWTLVWSFKCTTSVTLTHHIRNLFLLRVFSFGHEEQSSLGMVRYSLLFLSHVYRWRESFGFLPPVVAIPLIPLVCERECPWLPFPFRHIPSCSLFFGTLSFAKKREVPPLGAPSRSIHYHFFVLWTHSCSWLFTFSQLCTSFPIFPPGGALMGFAIFHLSRAVFHLAATHHFGGCTPPQGAGRHPQGGLFMCQNNLKSPTLHSHGRTKNGVIHVLPLQVSKGCPYMVLGTLRRGQ